MSMRSTMTGLYDGWTVDELFAEYRRNPTDELKWEIVMRYTGADPGRLRLLRAIGRHHQRGPDRHGQGRR